MALRRRNYSKRVEKWMLAHYFQPGAYPQKEIMKRLDIKHRSDFYLKFYQVIIEDRIKKIENDV